jgi:phospholipid-binding lipoprotein MlaA
MRKAEGHKSWGISFLRIPVFFVFFLMVGCVQDPADEANDPLEPINQGIFQFNLLFDDYILVPFSTLYNFLVPSPLAKGVKNFLNFLTIPISMTVCLLTGEGERAAQFLMRGVVNLSFGFFGFIDVATEMGLSAEPITIGQGFGKLGIGTGPYLMLPFLGPSNPRDFLGDCLEAFFDPYGRLFIPNARKEGYLVRQGVRIISIRAGVLEVERDIRDQSPDYYETFRCMYWQKAKGVTDEDTPTPER